ncbi:MAG: hypothetical protein PQJ59_16950 [Spirochaetales bacterium]|nr:hypothetical protein [Spirochaetales bacterium]
MLDDDPERAAKVLSHVEKANEIEIQLKTYNIYGEEAVREHSNIPEDDWECYKKEVRASNNAKNPWFITHCHFKRRTEIDPCLLLKNMQDIIEDYKPEGVEIKRVPGGNYCLIIDPVDAHIGGMVHDNSETLQDQIDRYVASVVYMLQKTEHILLDEIVYVLGNDLFHINADKPETRKGTPQETIGIPHEVNREILKMCIDVVYMLKQRCRKLHVMSVPGNHDFHNVCWLSLALTCKFSDDENIIIDSGIDERKYYSFGCTAFVFAHKIMKRQDRLSVIMFQEMLDLGIITDEIKYYEAHGGHFHVASQRDYPSATTNQMITQRILGSLTGQQRYSKDAFGLKSREAHGLLYSRDSGIEQQLIFRA